MSVPWPSIINFQTVLGVVVVASLVISHRRTQRAKAAKSAREKAAMAFAAERGWTYTDEDDSVFVDAAQTVGLFRSGWRRYARRVIRGEYKGYAVTIFDFNMVTRTGSGDSRRYSTFHYGIVWLHVPDVSFPLVCIGHDSGASRAIDNLTNSDIHFDSEDFDRAYRVESEDREFAYAVVNPRAIEVLMSAREGLLPDNGDVGVFRGYVQLGISHGRVNYDHVEQQLDLLHRLVEHLPPYVFDTHAGSSAQAVEAARPEVPLPPAAWYLDPEGFSRLRYWDGAQWTQHYAPLGPSQTPG